jgi:hypothetical protein
MSEQPISTEITEQAIEVDDVPDTEDENPGPPEDVAIQDDEATDTVEVDDGCE